MNKPIPDRTADFIRLLDKIVEPAVVRGKSDLDEFQLGFQAGQRDLVDMMMNKIGATRNDT